MGKFSPLIDCNTPFRFIVVKQDMIDSKMIEKNKTPVIPLSGDDHFNILAYTFLRYMCLLSIHIILKLAFFHLELYRVHFSKVAHII